MKKVEAAIVTRQREALRVRGERKRAEVDVAAARRVRPAPDRAGASTVAPPRRSGLSGAARVAGAAGVGAGAAGARAKKPRLKAAESRRALAGHCCYIRAGDPHRRNCGIREASDASQRARQCR